MYGKERTVSGFQTPSVAHAQAGKQHAVLDAEVERAVFHCAWSLLGQAGITRADIEDIEQELRTELLVYLPRFDPRKGKRATLVARILEHKAASLLRHRLAGTRTVNGEQRSLSDEVQTPDGPVPLGDIITDADCARRLGRETVSDHDRASLKMDLASVIATLPEELRGLCEEMKWKSISQIARERGVDKNWVRRRVAKIRKHFSDFGLQEYLADKRTESVA